MIGIDISERSVKIIRLSNKSDHKLLSHCWAEVPEGVVSRGVIQNTDALQHVVAQALHHCNIDRDIDDVVVASIPETQSFLRVIEIPLMDEVEIGEAVKWEVAQHIPFGLENVYIDWQAVERGHPAARGRREVLVGAAEKRVVDPLLRVLAALHLDVAALELESQAIVRVLVSREQRGRSGLLIVDLGGSATNVIIHDHGTTRFTASLQRGAFDVLSSLSAAERNRVTGPPKTTMDEAPDVLAGKLQAPLEQLVIEVQGIVEFYNGIDTEHEVKEILLTGGGANFPGLDRVFLKYFDNVHVHRGNPWVNLLSPRKDTRPPLGLQESVHFSTALGLAFRQVVV